MSTHEAAGAAEESDGARRGATTASGASGHAEEAAALARRVGRLIESGRYVSLHAEMLIRTEAIFSGLSDPKHFSVSGNSDLPPADAAERAERYEALVAPLVAAFVVGCYWGESRHAATWTECLDRVANPPRVLSSGTYAQGADLFRRYPALLLCYAGGVAAVAAGRYEMLAPLLTAPTMWFPLIGSRHALASGLTTVFPLGEKAAGLLLARYPGEEGSGGTPWFPSTGAPSRYLSRWLRPFFDRIILGDERYDRAFAEFEFWLDHAGVEQRDRMGNFRVLARSDASYVSASGTTGRYLVQELDAAAQKAEDTWPPLRAGLFDGSFERYRHVRQLVR